jgi:hypothetical protein
MHEVVLTDRNNHSKLSNDYQRCIICGMNCNSYALTPVGLQNLSQAQMMTLPTQGNCLRWHCAGECNRDLFCIKCCPEAGMKVPCRRTKDLYGLIRIHDNRATGNNKNDVSRIQTVTITSLELRDFGAKHPDLYSKSASRQWKINFKPMGAAAQTPAGWLEDNGKKMSWPLLYVPLLDRTHRHEHFYLQKAAHGILPVEKGSQTKLVSDKLLNMLHSDVTSILNGSSGQFPSVVGRGFAPLHIALRRGRQDLGRYRQHRPAHFARCFVLCIFLVVI